MSQNIIRRLRMAELSSFFLLACLSFMTGYFQQIQKNKTSLFVNPTEIQWIRITSGFRGGSMKLSAGHDDQKIDQLVKMINSGTNMGKHKGILLWIH